MLLRPTDDAAAADVDDSDGGHYERIGVLDRPEPACVPEVTADLSAFRREQARRRCTMLLRCLCGVAISTGLIGMWPGLHVAWVFTVLSGLCALGLVGLMAYAKELQAEQRRRRTRGAPARRPGRAEATSIRRPPAIPVPGTTTTTSRSPGSQHADTACGLFREDLGRPTILGVAGGVAQLAERYVRNVEAVGSNPITSTRRHRRWYTPNRSLNWGTIPAQSRHNLGTYRAGANSVSATMTRCSARRRSWSHTVRRSLVRELRKQPESAQLGYHDDIGQRSLGQFGCCDDIGKRAGFGRLRLRRCPAESAQRQGDTGRAGGVQGQLGSRAAHVQRRGIAYGPARLARRWSRSDPPRRVQRL